MRPGYGRASAGSRGSGVPNIAAGPVEHALRSPSWRQSPSSGAETIEMHASGASSTHAASHAPRRGAREGGQAMTKLGTSRGARPRASSRRHPQNATKAPQLAPQGLHHTRGDAYWSPGLKMIG